MSESDGLFTDSLLSYIRTTTDTQWEKIDRNKTHYFSTSSLDALLTDMEAQIGVHPPLSPQLVTHVSSLGSWIGDVTLAQLKSRVEALESEHTRLATSTSPTNIMNAWSLGVSIQQRSNDLTYLGVYLYGIGVSDGLYRPGDD